MFLYIQNENIYIYTEQKIYINIKFEIKFLLFPCLLLDSN